MPSSTRKIVYANTTLENVSLAYALLVTTLNRLIDLPTAVSPASPTPSNPNKEVELDQPPPASIPAAVESNASAARPMESSP